MQKMKMASSLPLFLLLLTSISTFALANSQLSENYYQKTCPQFEDIMLKVVSDKYIYFRSTAAGALRVFFHDCMVDGCDASVLLNPTTHANQTEKSSDLNESLPGDAIDVVTRAKQALELTCPNVVSCADILAYATRNLVKIAGGPLIRMPLGRKDSLVSVFSHVEPNIPRANTSLDEIIGRFNRKGITVEEMVALIGGGHTIGFAHCKEFANRIFGYKSPTGFDPSMNPKFALRLREICANYTLDPNAAAFLDPITASFFDNMFFRNLQRGLVLLDSDQVLITDNRTRPSVELFARNQTIFFEVFARAMEKISVLEVKTGKDGEIRSRCDQINQVQNY